MSGLEKPKSSSGCQDLQAGENPAGCSHGGPAMGLNDRKRRLRYGAARRVSAPETPSKKVTTAFNWWNPELTGQKLKPLAHRV